MTLKSFLDNRMTETAFAALLGVSQVTINRYVNGKRFPTRAMILRIEKATSGKVRASDWYRDPPAPVAVSASSGAAL